MATTNNPLVQGASGVVGGMIIYKKYYDKTVISKYPDMSKRVLSPKQIDSNERMSLANAYAKFIYETEEGKIRARIRLKLEPHKSLFHALVKEHLDHFRKVELDKIDSDKLIDVQ